MAESLTCPHGYPSPKSCIECMEEGPVAPPRVWHKVANPFPARYLDECTCGNTINVGDMLQRWDLGDEETKYLEVGCTP